MIPLALADQVVTWVKVDPPRFDLVGVVLGSLGLAGLLAALAFVLGVFLGLGIIWRRRAHPLSFQATSLQLHSAPSE